MTPGKTLLTDEQCSRNIKGNSVSLITHSVLTFFSGLELPKVRVPSSYDWLCLGVNFVIMVIIELCFWLRQELKKSLCPFVCLFVLDKFDLSSQSSSF